MLKRPKKRVLRGIGKKLSWDREIVVKEYETIKAKEKLISAYSETIDDTLRIALYKNLVRVYKVRNDNFNAC